MNPLRHEYRWTRHNPETRTRWVYGWLITVTGTAAKQWEGCNSFTLTSREDALGVTVTRSNISSVSAAMTQALAVVRALQHLNLGTRHPHAPPKGSRR